MVICASITNKKIESVLSELLYSTSNNENTVKRRKLDSKSMEFKIAPGLFNRFRLTGPNSQAVLTNSLKCFNNPEHKTEWLSYIKENGGNLYLKEKSEYWQNVTRAIASPSQLPPGIVISLIVKDPRLCRPSHRTKAKAETDFLSNKHTQTLVDVPSHIAVSPIWNSHIHNIIKRNKLTNGQFIQHVTKTHLVPGVVNEDDPALQSIPIVLIQRPGSQNPEFKKLGYGSGWDIILPSGYGLPFWHTFIMFGARSGGLRETESLAFEMGEHSLPPDSNAGKEEEKRIETELREKYFKLPPSKRVNYIKLAVNSPFICQWKILLNDWHDDTINNFFVLRDKRMLIHLQECVSQKKQLPQINKPECCLIPVYIKLNGKGVLKRHALICLPLPGDVLVEEPHHADPNEKLRKEKRLQHLANIKRLRRKKTKLRKEKAIINNGMDNKILKGNKEPSEYVKCMQNLWVPHTINNVRSSASREVIGYLTQGAFSFSEARSCGLGYVSYIALDQLLKTHQNRVLTRNTSSRKYRLASLHIMQS